MSDPHPPISRGALAPELRPEAAQAAVEKPKLAVVPPPPPRTGAPAAPGPAMQASLFGPVEVARTSAPSQPAARTATPRTRRERVEHPRLDFVAEGAHALGTSCQAARYCHADVALASHRAMAAIIDTGIGLAGAAVFLATFHFASGMDIEFTRQTTPLFAGFSLAMVLLYRVLFCLGDGDTVGLRWTNLRLVDFDGRPPTRKKRFSRLGGGIVSLVAAGMGLLWALVDEEKLTWHDQISGTFPTPLQPQA